MKGKTFFSQISFLTNAANPCGMPHLSKIKIRINAVHPVTLRLILRQKSANFTI